MVFIVEEEEKHLIWGPFQSANQAAEWATANLKGLRNWVIRPVELPSGV